MEALDNHRTFVAVNEPLNPPVGLSLYGFDSGNGHSHPWEICRVADFPATLADPVQALSLSMRQRDPAWVPHLVEREVFCLKERMTRRSSHGRWFYYAACLNTKNQAHWSPKQIVRYLRTSGLGPAKPGELIPATPTEMSLLCGEWLPDDGTAYSLLLPLVAIGGRPYLVKEGQAQSRTAWLELTRPEGTSPPTLLRVGTDHCPSFCHVLVRSRRYL